MTLYLILGLFLLLLACLAAAWWAGKQWQQLKGANRDAKAKDEQLKVAANPPDRAELDERLRRDDF